MSQLPITVYAACAQRKRTLAPPVRLANAGPRRAGVDLETIFHAWTAMASDPKASRLPFEQIYLGGFWGFLRHAERSKSIRVNAISAGFGLLAPGSPVPNYDATFSDQGANAITIRTKLSASMANRLWWKLLCNWEGPGSGIRCFYESAASDAGIHVVALPEAYLDAIWEDLALALDDPAMAKRIIVFTTPSVILPGESDRILAVPSGLRAEVGGTVATVVPRVALKMAQELGSSIANLNTCRSFIAKMRSFSQLSPKRERMSDQEVRSFVDSLDPHHSYTSALRRLRSSGRACEMKRFKQLYLETLATRE